MAQVAGYRHSKEDIDYHLDYQFSTWRSIPEYVAWWPEMDMIEREDFHLEWVGITEDRLKHVQQWAREGLLTTEQYARFNELMDLVNQHRPALEALLKT